MQLILSYKYGHATQTFTQTYKHIQALANTHIHISISMTSQKHIRSKKRPHKHTLSHTHRKATRYLQPQTFIDTNLDDQEQAEKKGELEKKRK